jgi:hypothetical protein
MFEASALAEEEELGSNILHLETPEIQVEPISKLRAGVDPL